MSEKLLHERQILPGPLFSEPMRVVTVRANGPDTWVAGLVGTHSERFRQVTLTRRDLEGLTILDARHTYAQALDIFVEDATFFALQHDAPARIDFYRARVVDGLGQVIHERLFAVELSNDGKPSLREPNILANFLPADTPDVLPTVATVPEARAWLNENALTPFLEETRKDRLAEVERIAQHLELSLTELLQRADDEIGKAQEAVDRGDQGAEGRFAQAEAQHAEWLQRREQRRKELDQQRALLRRWNASPASLSCPTPNVKLRRRSACSPTRRARPQPCGSS